MQSSVLIMIVKSRKTRKNDAKWVERSFQIPINSHDFYLTGNSSTGSSGQIKLARRISKLFWVEFWMAGIALLWKSSITFSITGRTVVVVCTLELFDEFSNKCQNEVIVETFALSLTVHWTDSLFEMKVQSLFFFFWIHFCKTIQTQFWQQKNVNLTKLLISWSMKYYVYCKWGASIFTDLCLIRWYWTSLSLFYVLFYNEWHRMWNYRRIQQANRCKNNQHKFICVQFYWSLKR